MIRMSTTSPINSKTVFQHKHALIDRHLSKCTFLSTKLATAEYPFGKVWNRINCKILCLPKFQQKLQSTHFPYHIHTLFINGSHRKISLFTRFRSNKSNFKVEVFPGIASHSFPSNILEKLFIRNLLEFMKKIRHVTY